MSTPLSDTARNQGAINFLMLMVCAAVVWLAMQAVLPALYGEDCHEAESAILDGAMWAIVIGFYGRWIYGLICGGRVLLDCGPSPYRWINVALGVFLLVPFPVANFRAKRRQMLSMHALTARRSA